MNYKKFVENRLRIVDKQGREVPFAFNIPQNLFYEAMTGRDIILKARQEGFSAEILAMFDADFITMENSNSVVVADIADNATSLLDRVKFYNRAYEDITKVKLPLKYNSKYELYNEVINSKYTIGTAENTEFGRSQTITNLHLSEAAFYKHFQKILAGALQAVTPSGRVIIETTANGFNEFKEFWDKSVLGLTGFKAHFFPASLLYSPEFLAQKKQELGRYFPQEYPETAEEAFLTSGDSFFDVFALKAHLERAKDQMTSGMIY